MSVDDKMLLIRNYDLWCNLSDEEYDELKIEHHFMEVPKGEYIILKHITTTKFILSRMAISRSGISGKMVKSRSRKLFRKGELFGQFTLERNNLRGEFAQAHKQNVSICAFNIDDFEKLLKRKT